MVRKDIDQVVARNAAFYHRAKPGSALAMVRSIAELSGRQIKPLNQWDFDKQFYAYLDELALNAENAFSARASLDDDLIPSVYPWYGIAEHSAFAGGDVTFEVNTSYHHRIIEDMESFDKLRFSKDNVWYQRVVGGMRYLRERCEGKLLVKERGAMSPFDMLNMLRGNELFYDFYDYPERVDDLMSQCAEGLAWWMGEQYQAADHPAGGVVTGMDIWLPGRSFGHLSEDATVMCSPEMYRTRAREWTRKALEGFDASVIHVHSAGLHVLDDIVAIEKFRMVELSSDPKQPSSMEAFEKCEASLQGMIVIIHATLDEVKSNLELLSRNRAILWLDTSTLREAEEAVRFVRKELPCPGV